MVQLQHSGLKPDIGHAYGRIRQVFPGGYLPLHSLILLALSEFSYIPCLSATKFTNVI